MFCPNCGKQTDDNAAFCDSCGASLNAPPPPPSGQQQYQPQNQPGQQQSYQQSYQAPPEAEETSPTAIWSLVLAILGFVCCGCLASIPAIICGHIALKQIEESEGKLTGRGLALAGLIMGYIAIVLGVVGSIIYGAIIATNPDILDEIMRQMR